MRILIILLVILEMWLSHIYKKKRLILSILYIGVILWITVFSRTPGSERIFKGLFWEIQMGYWSDIVLNMLLFVPLGIFIGERYAIIIGFVLSLGVEIIQYIFVIGFCELDDILNNSIGTLLGVLFLELYKITIKLFRNE